MQITLENRAEMSNTRLKPVSLLHDNEMIVLMAMLQENAAYL
jgi:hypothetical protein